MVEKRFNKFRSYLFAQKSGKNDILLIVLLSIFIFIFAAFYSLGVLAEGSEARKVSDGINCGDYIGNYSACNLNNATCRWRNNSGIIAESPSCPIQFYNYNSTVMGTFVTSLGTNVINNNLTGGLLINAGCCGFKDEGSGGSGPKGCWSFDMNETGCRNSSLYGVDGCSWSPNNMNQNPMCSNNIGCCQMQGCWSFSGTQNATNNCTAWNGGICNYVSACPEPGGCCAPRACNEVTTQNNCEKLKSLGNPCSWNGSTCNMPSGGGFNLYNDTDTCFSKGGWWNSSGACVMPSGGGGGGGGGFMFAQEARCWFADQKPGICLNVTGCVYCSNTDAQINNASSACYNEEVNICQGHEPLFTNWNGTANINVTDINKTSMSCADIKLKQTCLCGPLPNCKWTNSSATFGPAGTSYCQPGAKSSDEMQLCVPPVMFCEDSKAKNNETLCNSLASNYMMPCKWDNTTTANNCTFNSDAVFGATGGEMDYNFISSETSCVASGGTWRSENYIDFDGSFKEDSWCEKGAMFDFSTGQASANKGNCDSDCWACEFNSTGSNYGGNATLAQQTCENSKKGVCKWKTDANAPNRLGWCDYPKEMSFGSGENCNSDCKACEFFQNPSQACYGSSAGCMWVNETNSPFGGYCLSGSKKSCNSDCFSCYDQLTCSNSTFHASLNCSWDTSSNFCKPSSFTGEICFNGKDDDGNGKMDCADPSCTYDQFCGGASIGSSGGVDCKKLSTSNTCRDGKTGSGKNCTWITPTWGGGSYCDFPGSSCWMFEDNSTACSPNVGCFWKNVTTGFGGFCEINETKASPCFSLLNSSSCDANNNCQWISDSFILSGGRCEFKPFVLCGNFSIRTENACNNVVGANCSWRNDSFSQKGGFCEPNCFSQTNNTCAAASNDCMLRETACEPEMFGNIVGGGGGEGCHRFDSNQTLCVQQNLTCSWISFPGSTQGACEGNGDRKMFESMDQSPPKILGNDPADTNPKEIDIREYGIKDMSSSLAFGIMLTNVTNAVVCRNYMIGGMGPMGGGVIGNGTATTKFYWHLDTNKNTTDGCSGVVNSTTNSTGYEFLIKYVTILSNLSASETKSLYRCSSGSWVLTNVPLSSNRQFMCSMSIPFESEMVGGVMIIVDKENLESFTTYNKSAPMRVMVTSANDSYNENNPLDWVKAPGYYTHGSADFKFVDCSNPNVKDNKCKNFQKFGFNVIEDCKNGKDDDADGLTDCSDPICTFTPVCAGGNAFVFSANANDKEAPNVAYSNVDTLHNGAFVKFDTNEPANGSLTFYTNDSSCTTANKTIVELGDPNINFDDYKPFHMVPLDDVTLPGFTNGLANGTTYFYKTSICDSSANCAESACQNFTTKSENAYKNFVFKMKLPDGFNVTIPALNYSGNFTTVVGGKAYESGIKTNASITKNINVSVNCGNQSIMLIGVDIFKPKSIDLTSAFICNTNSTNSILGMNSSSKSWNQVVSDLGMGGAGDSLKLTFPLTYNSSNNVTWCNDELTNCTNVNNYANCSSGGTGKTSCKIPTSLGFSAYNVLVAGTGGGSGDSGTSSGGGGGGGGGAVLNKTANKTTTTITPGEGAGEGAGAGEEGVGGGAGEEGAELSSGKEGRAGGLNSFIWISIGIIALIIIVGIIVTVMVIKRKRGY